MYAIVSIAEKTYRARLEQAIDLSIPLVAGPGRLEAWYVDPIRIEAVMNEHFVGSVAHGGSVNFRNIAFNPHGHGTHTESYGHITKEDHSVNKAFKSFHMTATLVSVEPKKSVHSPFDTDDLVISADDIPDQCATPALLVRTRPNGSDKLTRSYSSSNPPYLLPEAALKLVSIGVEHLLIDLPSVDREEDGGELLCHHIFWGIPQHPRGSATITELIYVSDEVQDGLYLLNLQLAPFENDASPSRPVIYPLEMVTL